MTLKIKIL